MTVSSTEAAVHTETESSQPTLLKELARDLDVSYATLWRWCCYGVTINNVTIYLESVRLPTGRASSMELYRKFVDEMTKAQNEAQ
jgi:hypothetical protein